MSDDYHHIKQLEADRDVLAAEVRAWRAWSDPAPVGSRTYCTGSWAQVESSRLDTDNNQVLDRTKEIK